MQPGCVPRPVTGPPRTSRRGQRESPPPFTFTSRRSRPRLQTGRHSGQARVWGPWLPPPCAFHFLLHLGHCHAATLTPHALLFHLPRASGLTPSAPPTTAQVFHFPHQLVNDFQSLGHSGQAPGPHWTWKLVTHCSAGPSVLPVNPPLGSQLFPRGHKLPGQEVCRDAVWPLLRTQSPRLQAPSPILLFPSIPFPLRILLFSLCVVKVKVQPGKQEKVDHNPANGKRNAMA